MVDAPGLRRRVRGRDRAPPAGAGGPAGRRRGVLRGRRRAREPAADRGPPGLSDGRAGRRPDRRLRCGLGARGAPAARRRTRASWCSSAASTSTTCSPPPPPARPTSRCVGLDAPGLDRAAVDHLRAPRRPPGRDRAPAAPPSTAAGCGPAGSASRRVVTDDQLDTLADAICADDRPPTVRPARRSTRAPVGPPASAPSRRVAGRVRRGLGPGRRARAHHGRRRARRRDRPGGGAGSCSSTPTRTAGRWPSSSASSTRSPGCSPPPGSTAPASSSSGSGRCSAGSTST